MRFSSLALASFVGGGLQPTKTDAEWIKVKDDDEPNVQWVQIIDEDAPSIIYPSNQKPPQHTVKHSRNSRIFQSVELKNGNDEESKRFQKAFETCHLDLGVLERKECSSKKDVCILPNVVGYDALWSTPYTTSGNDDGDDEFAMGICYPLNKLDVSYWNVHKGTEIHRSLQINKTFVAHSKPRPVESEGDAEAMEWNETFSGTEGPSYTSISISSDVSTSQDGTMTTSSSNKDEDVVLTETIDMGNGNEIDIWETGQQTCEIYCSSFEDKPILNEYDDGNFTGSDFQQIIDRCIFSHAMIYEMGFFDYPSLCPYDLQVPMNCWDVSRIRDMSRAFQNQKTFNDPLNCWDTSNVDDMHSMFEFASSFNQNIGMWDVSSVTDASRMFYISPNFAQPDLAKWNTESMENINSMFFGARFFNSAIGNWNTSSVTDMSGAFFAARTFDKPLYWDTSNVKHMYGVFILATTFNQDLSHWNTSNVENMAFTFRNAYKFNTPLETWDTSNVVTMQNTFHGAKAFNQPVENWDVGSVTNMIMMFNGAAEFNQCLGTWASRANISESIDTFLNETGVYRMFENSGCPSNETLSSIGTPLNWEFGPWCQDASHGCIDPNAPKEVIDPLEGVAMMSREGPIGTSGKPMNRKVSKSNKSDKSGKSGKSSKRRFLR